MKFRTESLLIALFLSVTTTCAQKHDTKLPADTISYFKNVERFYINNKKLTVKELTPMLHTFTSSAIEFRKYKRRATPGNIVLLTGIAAGVIAFTKLNKDTHFFTPYTITLFASNLVGIPLMLSANKHLRKSVRLYNREILK